MAVVDYIAKFGGIQGTQNLQKRLNLLGFCAKLSSVVSFQIGATFQEIFLSLII